MRKVKTITVDEALAKARRRVAKARAWAKAFPADEERAVIAAYEARRQEAIHRLPASYADQL